MSLLESMRSGTDSTFMQLVFAAVVVSFVAWGLGPRGDTTDTVAKVNGEAITRIELNQVYGNAERRQGRSMTPEQRKELQGRVFEDLIRRTALLQEAEALGLEVSDTEVAKVLLEYDAFKDAEGRFDFRLFENALRRQGLTRSQYEEQLREDLLLSKLQMLMMVGASVAEPVVEQLFVEENTKVDLQFVRVPPRAFYESISPTDAEIDAWIADHREAVQARYDKDFAARYDAPEKVTLRMIRLATRGDGLGVADLAERLRPLRAQLQEGADFDALARRWSEDRTAADGGLIADTPVRALDTLAAETLAALAPGELSDVVVGDQDVRLYRLEARTEARVIPVAEVERDIALDLMREEQAPVKAAEFAEQELLPAWREAGEPPAEALEAHQLAATTTGPKPVVSREPSFFGPPPEMLKAARTAPVGTVLDEVFEANGTLYVGKLIAREEADMSQFEEERDAYRENALAQRRTEFYKGWEDDVVQRARVQRYVSF